MRTRSIQFRLTIWYAIVLAAALALFSGLIWLSLRQRLAGELDEELGKMAGRFETYVRTESQEYSGEHLKGEMAEFCQALPASSYIDLTGSRGFDFHFPATGRQVRDIRTVRSNFRIGEESFSLQLGSSSHEIDHTLDLLKILLLTLIPAVIAIATLGGAWLSRRALGPVDEITAAARAIGIENLSSRLPVPATGDELQRLTEVWNTMLARLEAAVKTLSQFAADASHELRTPLAVIRTSAELALRRAREPEAYRDSLTEVAAEAERMTQLVEDLLFLARSDSRQSGMPMGPFDLRDALRDAVAEVHDLAAERNIDICLDLPPDESPLHGNRAACRRLFLVLLDNALKYSHPGGKVTVTLTASPGETLVSVQDFGIGISPEDLPHIFQRFYRADKARTRSGDGAGGHGLGLALAETLAQVHGANISVTSTEGEGSVFLVKWAIPSNA
jgi:two-component system heavy metal sensor histidine kinase CusS